MAFSRARFVRAAIATLVVAVAAGLLIGANSVAAPTCTISWDRGAGTDSWHTAANWTGNTLPGAGDVVCLPAAAGGTKVEHNGTSTVASIQAGDGQLDLPLHLIGGTLNISGTGANGSTLASLTQSNGGDLGGAGDLSVGAFTWRAGSHGGSGVTTVTGSLAVENGTTKFLQRTLRIDPGVTATQSNTSDNLYFV
ncbi:MAG: hypothetical protein LC790_10290, partial [Actinobacteria bacterium]|nr:hypothetical protein [Actinomycetota bacterium]